MSRAGIIHNAFIKFKGKGGKARYHKKKNLLIVKNIHMDMDK
jgi:hypothetical protein